MTMTIRAIGWLDLWVGQKIRRYRDFISFHFRMLPLCYHYVIIYAYFTQIMLLQRSSVMLFHAHQYFFAYSKNEDNSRNRMGGLVLSTFQGVHLIHGVKFSYASFMLSLRYRSCGSYKDYTMTKISPKKLCYVNNMLLCLFMLKWCYGSQYLSWLFLETLSSCCYTFTRTHIFEGVVTLWNSSNHKIF